MTSFAALLKNDIKLFIKDWKVCVLLLITPVIFIAFFTYSLTPYLNKTSFIEPFPVAVVDLEGTTVTRMLIKQVEEIDVFSEILLLEEDEAIKKLADKEVGAVIILPEDLSVSVSYGENKPVTVIGNSEMPLKAYVVKNIIQSAANLVSSAQSAIITIYRYDEMAGLSGEELEVKYNNAIADYFVEALSRSKVFTETEEEMQFTLTPAEYFTAALIVVFMMFAGMPGMKMLVSERSEGITKRLSASPVKMWKVILSKLLVSSLVLVIEFGVIVLFTSKVFSNYWGAPVKNILMLVGGIIVAVSAWSVFVAAISTTPASADIIGNLGVLLMAVAGGNIYPLSSMPKFVKGISKLTISRWAMDGFMVVFSGNDAKSTGVYALVLVMMGAVLFLASAVIMKYVRKG